MLKLRINCLTRECCQLQHVYSAYSAHMTSVEAMNLELAIRKCRLQIKAQRQKLQRHLARIHIEYSKTERWAYDYILEQTKVFDLK